MQVTLRNDWFDGNGKIWPKGVVEYHGDLEALPSSAKYEGKQPKGEQKVPETPPAIEGEPAVSAIASQRARIAEGQVPPEELPVTVPEDQLDLGLLGGKAATKK